MIELGNYIKEKRIEKNLSKRALAEAADISHTEIHRIETGERINPSPPLLKSIANALHVSYEELMEKAGYIDNTTEVLDSNKLGKEEEDRFIQIITPKLMKEGWAVELCSPSNIGDMLARKNDINWYISFKYINHNKEYSKVNAITQDILLKAYGKFAVHNFTSISKFTLVVNSEMAFKILIERPPLNLKMNISILLVDFETNSIKEEHEFIS